MSKNKLIYILVFTLILAGTGCKKQLQVGNPNAPTITGNVNTESGLYAFAQGSTYIDGFVNGDGWLGDTYFSLVYGYHELLADVVGADAANNQVSIMSVPDKVTTSAATGNTVIANQNAQIGFLRTYNTRANTGAAANVFYYQWLSMYALNNACNTILNAASGIKFSGDATTRANTVKAWCYWWKGYAYASIGSMYYSGLLVDDYNGASNHYLTHDSIIARSNYYFNQASSILSSIASVSDYNTTMGALLPTQCQMAPHGGIPTPTQWVHNINTMLARNILENKLNPFVNGTLNSTIAKSSTTTMSASDWAAVLNYATNGVQQGDVVFSAVTTSINSFFSSGSGTVSAMSSQTNQNSTFKLTERWVQDFKTGDQRATNNLTNATTYSNPNFSTRWSFVDGGNGASNVYVYASTAVGTYELYMAASYEENALILAEANIMTGKVDAGLAYVDAVRSYMGAGIAPVSGTGLSAAQAMTELTRERRVALFDRGLNWYDFRRWGWSYAIANGGGSYGNTFLLVSGALDNNTTIDYNFLDYWDVPADEFVLNPPGTGSAPAINPNF